MCINVFRVHTKPSGEENDANRQAVIKFRQEEGIIGVGWSMIDKRNRSEIEGQIAALENERGKGSAKSAEAAIRAVSEIRKNDLIWTRLNGLYYLCRANGKILWENNKVPVNKKYKDNDTGHYVSVDWSGPMTEDAVPGKVINSFRPARTIQKVNDVEEISKRIWNGVSETYHYTVNKRDMNSPEVFDYISAEDIEGLVILYLQHEGYYVYTSTHRPNTDEIECVLVKSNGSHRAFVQVKSGDEYLDPNAYKHLLKRNSDKVYLFSANETESGLQTIVNIKKEKLLKFMSENENLLPDLVKYWFDS